MTTTSVHTKCNFDWFVGWEIFSESNHCFKSRQKKMDQLFEKTDGLTSKPSSDPIVWLRSTFVLTWKLKKVSSTFTLGSINSQLGLKEHTTEECLELSSQPLIHLIIQWTLGCPWRWQ